MDNPGHYDEYPELTRAGTDGITSSIPCLLQNNPAALANVDQLVAAATARADEVNAKAVDTGLDGGKRNLDGAADTQPHDQPPVAPGNDSAASLGIKGTKMTPTTPSPISDQAAGDPKWRAELSRIAEDYQPDGASQAILALEEMRQALRELLESTACDCGVACRDDGDGKCRYSTAPTTGSAPDGWISTADRLPDVKVGTEREFIVACRRASNGKTYVFAASYLNEMGLMFDDDDCPEDGRPTTGWFNERNDIEYDNAFQNVCDEGDEVTHWMPLPDAPALLAASMGGDKA